ncbi:hypothetical protein SKAU_G00084610 [Synaphobranchus kaupii]|uniref:Uncharacterized protein n=1 Tax=Synaphobranchus kaupii TaxID=118154 RepID=A0A9Q1J5W8_SYNKA|nr:hypothetical protein SKAU_G00084610 [Synaphobranchus kaupii]
MQCESALERGVRGSTRRVAHLCSGKGERQVVLRRGGSSVGPLFVYSLSTLFGSSSPSSQKCEFGVGRSMEHGGALPRAVVTRSSIGREVYNSGNGGASDRQSLTNPDTPHLGRRERLQAGAPGCLPVCNLAPRPARGAPPGGAGHRCCQYANTTEPPPFTAGQTDDFPPRRPAAGLPSIWPLPRRYARACGGFINM